ncbi:ATP-dependent DNA helicase RecG [Marinibaculum pumilum]|uniref:Probable DNA 3'-5' helicase RecG n=1 Tax=Marinibaculum pumilum TaxID=1766165 RepID=A0ABV7KU33_9PROT
MRPPILFPAFTDIKAIKGCGPRLAEQIGRLAGPHAVDLWWHLPSGLVDRRYQPRLADAVPGRIASLHLRIGQHQRPRSPRQPYRIMAHDETGEIALVFFNARPDWLARTLPEGEERIVSGRLETFQDRLQMTHPDLIVTVEDWPAQEKVQPVYPLTAGLSPKVLGRIVAGALALAPDLPEWQDRAFHERQHWPSWLQALQAAHRPAEEADLSPLSPARARLAYDELLAGQLALALMRGRTVRRAATPLQGDGRLVAKALAALPFSPTPAQSACLAEIAADLASGKRMHRLLQGDVGSGKTLVAALSALTAVEAGHQAAIMAPTEILARQHAAVLQPLADAAGIRLAVVTGRDSDKAKAALGAALEAGEIDLIVGTHALIQSRMRFRSLGLAVIDEQHRFGVHQRILLGERERAGDGPAHLLVMTATPIPRTLTLALYGDMEVSRLEGKPPGRQPGITSMAPVDRLDDVIDRLRRRLDEGAKAYWICPLVADEDETAEQAAAEGRARMLSAVLGADRVALLHGRLKPAEKDAAMARFADPDGAALLVATTVVEVGVDVPAASLMVVEEAERFGLAQLHQLRGRIGRGTAQGRCLLLYTPPLSDVARARLETLCETDDGFVIAERDLALRGAGEVLGTRQAGLPQTRLADLAVHGELLAAARDDARLIMTTDPELTGPRSAALKVLLYLFERDAAARLFRSG